ncbi:MAG: DUF2157 domain-containing protein [Pseudomonadota bacterium]
MNRYLKRLEADIDRWIAAGLVEAGAKADLLRLAAPARSAWSAAGAGAILGAVLLALAAITFVAANWADMARVLRFAVILGALWAAFGGAAFAFSRGSAITGHALALLGAALFGAAIMLTAQTFNMASFRNTGVLIWAGGALAAAVLLQSRPVMILAGLLLAGWIGLESASPYAPAIVWSFIPAALATAAAASWLRSAVSWNLVAIALFIWLWSVMAHLAELEAGSTLGLICLVILISGALALLAATGRDSGLFGAGVLCNWSAVMALAGGFLVQIPFGRFDGERASATADRWAEITGALSGPLMMIALGAAAILIALSLWRSVRGALPWTAGAAMAACAFSALALPFLAEQTGIGAAFIIRITLGALIFILAAGLITAGGREGRRFIGALGVILFIAQSLYVYTVLFGSLLDTALFFFIGGALLLGLSLAAARLGRKASPAEPEVKS